METPLRYACVLIDEIFKLTIANKEHEDLLRMIVELLIPGKKIRKLTFNDKENHGLALSDKNVTFDLYCTSCTWSWAGFAGARTRMTAARRCWSSLRTA